MSKEPPPKKLRQSSILDSFRKQISASKTGNVKSRSGVDKEATSKSHKEATPSDVNETNMDGREDLRKRCAFAADKRNNDQTDNSEVNSATKGTQPKDVGDLSMKPSGAGMEKQGSFNSATPSSPLSECSPTLEMSQPLFDEDFDQACMPDSSESQDSDECSWKGVPLAKLKSAPSCLHVLPDLKSTGSHVVMFEVPLSAGQVPKPHPRLYQDRWNPDFVKMPCSPENLYPVESGNAAGKELKNRWDLIKGALLHRSITCSSDLEEAILTYNTRYSEKWSFKGLHRFFNEEISKAEANTFFQNVLPKMIDLALNIDKICTKSIPLLKKDQPMSITMSQQQAASLLANAFFCTYPRRNARAKRSEYASYPDINFSSLFMDSPRKLEKLKCLFNYFRRVTEKMPTGTLTFTRQLLREFPQWNKSSSLLTPLHVTSRGLIENDGIGMLQVDFANKYLGGGALSHGLVQEEIRFLICPELIISRLFTEVLDNHECLIITGCEQFSNYTGYADSFLWAGDHHDPLPRDSWQRKCTSVVAIDALVVRSYPAQFQESQVIRELNKAYCGFLSPGIAKEYLPAVATGNWGCGAFGGDPQLKALLQMMAAAEAGREVCYFTFGDRNLRDKMYNVHKLITEKQLQVSDLWALIQQYNKNICTTRKQSQIRLYDYIARVNNAYDDLTDEESDSSSVEMLANWESNKGKKSPDYTASTP